MTPIILILALAASALTAGDTPDLQRFSQTARHMGVEFEVVLYAPSEMAAAKGFAAAFARIAQLDRTLSDYDPQSELSRLSEAAPTSAPVKISDDLWAILQHSQTLSKRTSGTFDITIGPLTKLWRRARRNRELPAADQLAAARQSVGYQHLRLDPAQHTAELLVPAMRLDAGGIAKGFAADEALATLKRLGITRALVRASGDIAAGDPPPGESGWLIGLAPLDPDAPPVHFIRIANQAVSTSGDSRQHLEIAGRRYSHIIDPRTGLGIGSRSSVSIVAPRGIDADSLASAVSVLGPENGLALIEATPDAAAMLLYTTGDSPPHEYRSHRFAKLETTAGK
jgi:thiamine biosynthesis lipoprotein